MKLRTRIIPVIAILIGCAPLSNPPGWQDAARKTGAPTIPESKLCANLVTKAAFPNYPEQLRNKQVEGWVVIGYDLDGSGKVSNARVLDSKPKRTFDLVALQALEKTHFKEGAVKSGCESVSMFAIGK